MEIMSNILTMKIFHGYQSFLKEWLVFKNMRRTDRKLNVTPKRKNNNLFKGKSQTQNLLKTDKTTENVARYVPANGYLSCWESKSGNIDGYYYDFGLR